MSKYPEIHEFDGSEFIRCADFDRVTAERDEALDRVAELESDEPEWSAMQQKLGDANVELQQRMSAADERAGVLEKALSRIARPNDCGCLPCHSDCTSKLALEITVEEMRETARAALKPAEGCGDA